MKANGADGLTYLNVNVAAKPAPEPTVDPTDEPTVDSTDAPGDDDTTKPADDKSKAPAKETKPAKKAGEKVAKAEKKVKLAHTGADIAGMAGAALVLIAGGAAIARRKND